MQLPPTDLRTAEELVDTASRLDAGLPEEGAAAGETPVASLRRRLRLRGWEWATLDAAQTAGALPAVLRQLARAREDRAALRRQVVAALAYPVLVLLLCGLVGGIVLSLGSAPRGWLWSTALLLAAAVGSGAWLALRLRDPLFDADRVPVVGRLSRAAGELPYLVALRALYSAGVPMRRAHPEAAAAAAIPWVKARLFLASSDLEAGETLAVALDRRNAVTRETLTLVRDGERTGQLEDALGRAASRRREELARSLHWLTRALGWAAYAYAVLSVLWIAVRFYGALYGRL
jgi:general secretion pathway protein F